MNESGERAVRAVVFDIGDTLISTLEPMKESARMAALDLFDAKVIRDPAKLVSEFFKADAAASFLHINHFFSHEKIARCAIQALAELDRTSTWSIASIGARYLAYYREHLRARIIPNERVQTLLCTLRRKGFKLGVISNGTLAEQVEVLVRMEIADQFEDVLISEELGMEKPAAEVFRSSARRLSVAPEECVYVGNSWEGDILGAISAGFAAIHIGTSIAPSGGPPVRKMRLSTVSQLQDIAGLFD